MNLLFACHQFLPEHIGGTEIYTRSLASRAMEEGWNVLVVSYVENPSGKLEDSHLSWSHYESIPTAKIHFNLSLTENPMRAEYNNDYLIPFWDEITSRFLPDLVHHTHSMKLSGSALNYFSERNIPNILTMPDYWYVCPRHTLVRWNDEVCNGPRSFYDCLKCVQDTHGFFPENVQEMSPLASYCFLGKHDVLPVPPADPSIKQAAKALRKRESFLRKTAMRADHILALSRFQRKILLKRGYSSKRLTFLPHGIETEGLSIRSPKEARDKSLRISFIGSLVPHKGLSTLLEAFALAKNPLLHLTIYGSLDVQNMYHSELKAKVDRMERVEFGGTFHFKEIGHILNQTEILAMPANWYENDPFVVKYALYCHIPVLASDIGSLSEMITHGSSGWLLPRANVKAWADTLREIKPGSLPDFQETSYTVPLMDDHYASVSKLYKECTQKHA